MAAVGKWLGVGVICAILVVPGLILVPISFTATDFMTFPPRGFSFRWYVALVTEAQWREALANSFLVALGAAAVAVLCGVPAALALRRLTGRFVSEETAATLPLVVPTVVLGVGLYRWYLERGWVGSRTGLALAHAALGAPLVLLTVLATLARVDPALESAALTLGANRWRAVWTVTLPLALPGIVAGGFFAFITSFDEIALAFFLTDASMKTLPKVLFDQATYVLRPTLAVASTVLILLSVLAVSVGLAAASPRRGGR